jgi:hypothetical protein
VAIDQGRDPGRIITAIFETPQPIQQPWRHYLFADDANNPAH